MITLNLTEKLRDNHYRLSAILDQIEQTKKELLEKENLDIKKNKSKEQSKKGA